MKMFTDFCGINEVVVTDNKSWTIIHHKYDGSNKWQKKIGKK